LIYVDSNYWIYWLDSRLTEHKHVVEPIRRAISTGIVMSYVTLLEVAHHMRNLPKNEFSEMLGKIQNLSTLSMRELDSETARLGLELLAEYASKGLGGRDCIILATMRLTNTKKILTHDSAFSHVRGIDAEDSIPTGETEQEK
jgi:predicted nucleic acid-binding protein